MRPHHVQHGPIARSALCAAGLGALFGGCAETTPPAAPRIATVVMGPIEIAGPVEQPGFVGRAIAESLVLELATLPDLRVSAAPPSSDDGVATLTGTFRRGAGGEASCLELHARMAGWGEPLWSVVRCSEHATIADLIFEVTDGCMDALERSPSARYPYIGRVVGSDDYEAAPGTAVARDRFRAGDYAGSAAAAAELIADFPDEPAAHVARAWALTLIWDGTPTAENLSALRDELDVLKRLDPATPYAGAIQAFVYRAAGAPDAARQLYARMLERDDLTPAARAWVLRQRSFAHVQIGQFDAARRDGEEAVRLDPANAQSRIADSRAAEAAGDLDGALARATEAVALEPDSWRHLQRVGIMALRAGLDDRSVESLRRACDLSRNQETCANLAVALQYAGDADAALRAASDAETLTESRWGAYNLACFWSRRGVRDRAIEALRRASDLGYADVLITTDPDLDAVRAMPAFESVVETVLGRMRSRRTIATTVFPWQG